MCQMQDFQLNFCASFSTYHTGTSLNILSIYWIRIKLWFFFFNFCHISRLKSGYFSRQKLETLEMFEFSRLRSSIFGILIFFISEFSNKKKRKKKIINYFEIIFMPKFFLEILWARKTSKMSHFSTLKVAPLLRCTKNQWVISKRNSKTHPTAIYSCGFLVPKFLRAACKVLNNAKPKLFLIERQNYSFALF